MMDMEIGRICSKCGKPLTALENGKFKYLRCLCEWERGFSARMSQSIHPEYRTPRVRTMVDWDPPLFASGGYREYVEVQKMVAVSKIFKWAFGDDRRNICRRISRNENLFIRGPAGAGRGLLVACVKMMAVIREISTTPLPSEYDILKAELSEAEAFGMAGDEARLIVHGRYCGPKIMVVENARAEKARDGSPKKIRGAQSMDALLAKRASKPGSIVMSSFSFIGEIQDSMGDRMQDVLLSPKTETITLLHPDETVSLRTALADRRGEMLAIMKRVREPDGGTEKSRTAKMQDEEEAARLEEAFYFEEAFPGVKARQAQDNLPIQLQVETMGHTWPTANLVMKAWGRFSQDREENSADYKSGVEKAKIAAAKSCKFLGAKLSEKELLEVGNTLSVAARLDLSKDDAQFAHWRKQIKELKIKTTRNDNGV